MEEVKMEVDDGGNNDEDIETVEEKLKKLAFCTAHSSMLEISMNKLSAKIKGASPTAILNSCWNHLTPYERSEILDYKRIYFIGPNARKHYSVLGHEMSAQFDDEKRFYKVVNQDHIHYRYEALKLLGRGSFGEVIRAYDHKNEEFVAIKISVSHPVITKQAEVENNILRFLKIYCNGDKENIVQIKKSFTFRNHFCSVFEILSASLYQLSVMNEGNGFSESLTKKFISSILKSLVYLSDHRVVHRDLKPENILKCPGSCELKLADFGSSCYVRPDMLLDNENAQTIWYRAPEVLLGGPYGIEVDMWSLGCLVPELLKGKPLLPGETDRDQMAVIIEMIGMPPPYIIQRSKLKDVFFKPDGTPQYFNCNIKDRRDRQFMAGRSPSGIHRGYPHSKPLAIVLGETNKELLDFLTKCLTWDPHQRMTPREASAHPWLAKQNSEASP